MKKRNDDYNIDKMVLVSTLYYKNNLSQQEIAKKLNVSRPWISKLLKRAQDSGIVKISIQSPVDGNSPLEKILKDSYHLNFSKVISNHDSGKDYVSMAAANYFISIIQEKDTIGIGWGSAVSRFIQEMIAVHMNGVKTVPLAGSFGTTFETLPNYSAIQLAEKLSGTANLLHAPALCSSEEEYNTLMKNAAILQTIEMGEHSDIIVTGIGALGSSFITRNHILNEDSMKELENASVTGDILLQFFDKDSMPVAPGFAKNIIKADIYKAKENARCVIAIAEGIEKVDIIHSVLSSGLVDAFFTNTETAKALIDKYHCE